ncbi:MAG TPA: hypothetical protein VGJ17_05010 [Candidatus Limnocylindrales bacterium]|jgi:hypothetical protein
MRRQLLIAIPLFAVLGAATAGLAMARSGVIEPDAQAVRSVVSIYHDYAKAAAAGYSVGQEPCVSSPAGTMGIHASNPGIIGTGVIDALKPQILIYLPRTDGTLRLVAVEYWHVALANTANGPAPWFGADAPPLGFFNPAPSVLGHTFDGPMAGHNPQMPWHYDLHAWVIENNPTGTFSQWNPSISCPPAG